MTEQTANLRYTASHEWVEDLGNGQVRIGITDHAQEALGDLVYVELPEVGAVFQKGDPCAIVESVKAASEVYAPVSGEVVEVNEALSDSPELINASAFGDGWLCVIELSDATELDDLLDEAAYAATLTAEGH